MRQIIEHSGFSRAWAKIWRRKRLIVVTVGGFGFSTRRCRAYVISGVSIGAACKNVYLLIFVANTHRHTKNTDTQAYRSEQKNSSIGVGGEQTQEQAKKVRTEE
tara:strand:- start:108 stop:419 length:312 start_codon:yes stop_codon:yes gene_type:complete